MEEEFFQNVDLGDEFEVCPLCDILSSTIALPLSSMTSAHRSMHSDHNHDCYSLLVVSFAEACGQAQEAQEGEAEQRGHQPVVLFHVVVCACHHDIFPDHTTPALTSQELDKIQQEQVPFSHTSYS